MTQQQIARFAAIRKSIKARQNTDGSPKALPIDDSMRATVAVTYDSELAACVEAAGFDEHRKAA